MRRPLFQSDRVYRPLKALTTRHLYPECAVARTDVSVSTMQSYPLAQALLSPFKCSMFMGHCPYAIGGSALRSHWRRLPASGRLREDKLASRGSRYIREGNAHAESGSMPGVPAEGELGVELLGVLADGLQCRLPVPPVVHVKAHALGTYLQYHHLLLLFQAQLDGAGNGMTGDLVQYLLGDAIQDILALDRQRGFDPQMLVHRYVASQAYRCQVALQDGDQPLAFQQLRPQFYLQRVQIGQPKLGEEQHGSQWGHSRGGIADQRLTDMLRIGPDVAQIAGYRPVQLACQADALQERGVGVGLGDEAGIFQREEGSLRSQGKGKTGMLGSVGVRSAMVQGEDRQHLLLHEQGDKHP